MRTEAEVKKTKLRPLHPRREILSREEELRRFRSIEEWRRAHLDEFKKTHPKVHDPDWSATSQNALTKKLMI